MSKIQNDEMMGYVTEETRKLAVKLVLKKGIPLDVVLAAMHAHTIAAVAEAYGGTMAAAAARQAADRVQDMPSRETYDRIATLASVPPAGTA